MKGLVFIPWAETEWTADGRMAARTPLPLTPEGLAQAQAWGAALADRELYGVYASEEQTAQETAAAVAAAADTRVRSLEGLEEVNCGLWEGLTEDTLRLRFPKAYKRWRDDPSSVCPPDGEAIPAAIERIRKALGTLRRKLERANVAVVLGPTACAAVRCDLAGAPLGRLRDFLATGPAECTDVEAALQAPAPTNVEQERAGDWARSRA